VNASHDLEGVRALRAASRALDASDSLEDALAAAVRALVPGLADACTIRRDDAAAITAGEEPASAHVLELPIETRGRALGTLRLVRARAAWDEHDRLLADECATRVGLAIAGAELADAADTSTHYDQFLATLSHELRSPLNVISGWINLLRDERLPPDRRVQALDVVARNARVQTRLIEDILDASRIVAGKMRVEPRAVQLDVVVADCLEALRPQADAAGVALHAQLAPARVRGDAVRLAQVVHNLVGNALRYTSPRGRIDVTLEGDAHTVTLRVTDDGAGISPDFLPHVFERFRQGERRRAAGTKGLGLGLFIVRHIAQLHGGTITAASDGPGRGATFTLRLPASR
jgi:signal transduction histidine kinase